jgi:hypothetical protein
VIRSIAGSGAEDWYRNRQVTEHEDAFGPIASLQILAIRLLSLRFAPGARTESIVFTRFR